MKKLTVKQKWFENAWWWNSSVTSSCPRDCQDFDDEPGMEKLDGLSDVPGLYVDFEYADRCYIRAQFCCEKAGLA